MRNTRAIAAKILTNVLRERRSLTEALNAGLQNGLSARDQALVKEYCYGVLRWYFRLKIIADALLYKPLKSEQQEVEVLLFIGLYQCIYLKTPPHAAVSETVSAAVALKKTWAKGLINQGLRQFLRKSDALLEKADETEVGKFSHPAWLIKKIKSAWPEHWEAILNANNHQAPMFLRVNAQQMSREKYLEALREKSIPAVSIEDLPHAIRLESPQSVDTLPGFREGLCSVQDLASQQIIKCLDLKPGQRVLDACAAPGGKTAYLLEIQPELSQLLAIDADPQRLKRITENINRLKLPAPSLQVLAGDAGELVSGLNGHPFDWILIDAPCSATGVIRRHPDIKWLRQENDIAMYAKQQYRLLSALWPLLKSDGHLLYTTCSILPEENTQVLQPFLKEHPGAKALPISITNGISQKIGCQLLPTPEGSDGFYYGLLQKVK